MSNNILFIFEGEKTENVIINSLKEHVLTGTEFIKCAYAADIYDFYRQIANDDDLDTFNLIKEKSLKNQKNLNGYTRKDFAEIYFFFDYDGHATMARDKDFHGKSVKGGDIQLAEMLETFNDESDKGKMYISYPMVEALRHVVSYDTFHSLNVYCKGTNCETIDNCTINKACLEESRYKKLVADTSIAQLCSITSYSKDTWCQLINAHLSKMNYIVNSIYEFPNKTENQEDIFNNQLEKYINKPCPEVAVLSAFPLFVHDYYGNNKTKEIINS